MDLNIRIGKHYYSISIGHKTPWFEQVPFFILAELYYLGEGLQRDGPCAGRIIFRF